LRTTNSRGVDGSRIARLGLPALRAEGKVCARKTTMAGYVLVDLRSGHWTAIGARRSPSCVMQSNLRATAHGSPSFCARESPAASALRPATAEKDCYLWRFYACRLHAWHVGLWRRPADQQTRNAIEFLDRLGISASGSVSVACLLHPWRCPVTWRAMRAKASDRRLGRRPVDGRWSPSVRIWIMIESIVPRRPAGAHHGGDARPETSVRVHGMLARARRRACGLPNFSG
jgi:hypothetical protein